MGGKHRECMSIDLSAVIFTLSFSVMEATHFLCISC